MNTKNPTAYFHRPGKHKPQNRFQRQDGERVRARSKAVYAADPEKCKAINAEWCKANPEKRREHASRYWKRNSQRPEVKFKNAMKARIHRARKRIKKAYASLMIV